LSGTSTGTRAGAAQATPAAASGSNPVAGVQLWADPDSDAVRELAQRGQDGPGAAALARIAQTPNAVWLGDWMSAEQARARAEQVTTAATAAGQAPVLVLYAIPDKDAGGFSAGGAANAGAYTAWVQAVADGIGDRRAIVVVEPDALAQIDQVGEGDERTGMLRDALAILAGTGATSYLDAGNSGWVDADTMAARVQAVGLENAAGVALNTSNFNRTADEQAYGETLSAKLGGVGYVIDTSRNGNGPATGDLAWCNPAGRALGQTPTTSPNDPAAPHNDALLWVKQVGQSDGECDRGDPPAGTWMLEYAIGLASGQTDPPAARSEEQE